MRRLRTVPITLVVIVATAALSSTSLMSEGTRSTFDDPAAAPWSALLTSYTMMAAMTSPVLVAVLASRQTDIEHTGSGWALAAAAGFSPGRLCRAKFVTLGLGLAPAVLLQSTLVIAVGWLVGIGVPLEARPWIVYTLLLLLLDGAFCALHILLSAQVENQLVCVGVGILGAFLAASSLTMPGDVSRWIPWGYYSVIADVAPVDPGDGGTSAALAWIAVVLLLAGGSFVAATRRLDRAER